MRIMEESIADWANYIIELTDDQSRMADIREAAREILRALGDIP